MSDEHQSARAKRRARTEILGDGPQNSPFTKPALRPLSEEALEKLADELIMGDSDRSVLENLEPPVITDPDHDYDARLAAGEIIETEEPDDEPEQSDRSYVYEREPEPDLPPPPPRQQQPKKPKERPQMSQQPAQSQQPKKDAILNEQPYEKILGLVERYQGSGAMLTVEIKRQTPGASWAGVRTITIPSNKIFDVGDMVRRFAGGGTFVFFVRDHASREPVLPRWKESFEGAIIPPNPNLTILHDPETDQLVIGPMADSTSAGFSGMPSTVSGALTGGAYGSPLPSFAAQAPIPGYPAAPPNAPHFPTPQRDAAGHLAPPPEGSVPSWVRSYPPQQQWEVAAKTYEQKHGHPPPSGNTTADALAMNWVNAQHADTSRERAQVARLEARLEAQAMQTAQLQQTLQAQLSQSEKELERERSRQQTTLLEAKLTAMEARMSAPAPQKQFDLAQLAPFVPVLVAYVQNMHANTKIEQQTQIEQMKLMFSGNQQKQGPSEVTQLLAAVGPLLAPVLVQWVSNQSPDKVAELRESSSMQQQIMLKMMMDFIMANTPQDQPSPWWQEPLMGLFSTLSGVGGAMLMRGGQTNLAALPRPEQPLPPPSVGPEVEDRGPAAIIPPPPPSQSVVNFDRLFEHFAKTDPHATELTRAVVTELQRMNVDPRFLSHEWVVIIFNLHTKLDPNEMVPLFVNHIEHARDFSMLPEPLAAIFENPETITRSLITQLPIYSMVDKEYGEMIIGAISGEIVLREKERIAAETETDDEDGDEDGEDPESREEARPGAEVVEA